MFCLRRDGNLAFLFSPVEFLPKFVRFFQANEQVSLKAHPDEQGVKQNRSHSEPEYRKKEPKSRPFC